MIGISTLSIKGINTMLKILGKTLFIFVLIQFLPLQHAEAGVIGITNKEVSVLLERGVAVIDIRTEREWQETGVIPGSHLLTLFDERRRMVDPGGWLEKVRARIPADKPVILVCRVGKRTVPAARLLESEGYKTVYNVTGGVESWIKAGKPTVKNNDTVGE